MKAASETVRAKNQRPSRPFGTLRSEFIDQERQLDPYFMHRAWTEFAEAIEATKEGRLGPESRRSYQYQFRLFERIKRAHARRDRYNQKRRAKRLANISSTIDCECPQNLAQLVSDLTAFEVYSAQCANRDAEDAALHHYLHHTCAKARELIEIALKKVIDAEGISV